MLFSTTGSLVLGHRSTSPPTEASNSSDPVVEKSTNDCLRFAVRDGDGFGSAGKAVDAGKEESLTVGGREGSDQIKVDVAESGIG